MKNTIKSQEFLDYVYENQLNVNKSLNKVLWFMILTGPAIAVGVWAGAFPEVNYSACIITSIFIFISALIHTIFLKKKVNPEISKYTVLITIEIADMMMCYNHIGIYLTFFCVPLISLLYYDRKTLKIMSALSYIGMVLSEYLISDFSASLRIDKNAIEWFIGQIGGMTIEFIIMFSIAMVLNKGIERNIELMFDEHKEIEIKDNEILTDNMTGILNKKGFMLKTEELLKNENTKNFALLFLDLDHFKDVNDNLGHATGDIAIKDAAIKIVKQFRSADLVARFGGDEFLVFVQNIPQNILDEKLSSLHETIINDYTNREATVHVTASIGAIYCENALINTLELKELLSLADEQLYNSKNTGRNKTTLKIV